MNFIRRTVKNGCIMIGDTKLDISAKLGHLKDAYEGKDVHFGFRPEAIVLGEQENAYVLQATVELTEMLGDNTNVYVNIADANAILKVNPHDTPQMIRISCSPSPWTACICSIPRLRMSSTSRQRPLVQSEIRSDLIQQSIVRNIRYEISHSLCFLRFGLL